MLRVDQAKVVLSPQNSTAEVVITNEFPGDETEPETEESEQRLSEPDQPSAPGVPNSSVSGSDNSDGKEGESTPVRTGDETPVAQYLVLLALSALVILLHVILPARKRKKK